MIRQIYIAIGALKVSRAFILRYRLWEKWESMKWMHTLFTTLAIYVGLKMFGMIGSALANLGHLASGDLDAVKLGFNISSLPDWSFVQSDTYKYFFLFFVMAMVYHIGGRSLEIIYGIPYRPSFKLFVRSQFRTTILLFICFVLEQVTVSISSGVLSIFGGDWLSGPVKFLIQSFLFGAVFIDMLHEIRGWTLKQGIKHSFNYYPGISITLGAVGLLLSYVPFLGVLLNGLLTVAFLIAIRRVENTMAIAH